MQITIEASEALVNTMLSAKAREVQNAFATLGYEDGRNDVSKLGATFAKGSKAFDGYKELYAMKLLMAEEAAKAKAKKKG